MRDLTPALGIALLMAASPAVAQQPSADLKRELRNSSWQLVSLTITTPDGKEIQPQGPHRLGYTMFDATGHVISETLQPGVPKFASGDFRTGTDGEYVAAAKASLVDFGTYSVDEKNRRLVFHVIGASYPNWNGTDLTQQVELRGDQMIWKNAKGATQAPTTLVWQRLK